jgi:hypothetical protein
MINYENGGTEMKKINFYRVILAGFVAGIAFLFVEVIVEGFTKLVLGINEYEIVSKYVEIPPLGVLYHLIVFADLFCITILIMGVYAALRPRFSSNITAALTTGLSFWLFFFLVMISFANVGILRFDLVVPSLIFNLIELPAAVIAASFVYKDA